MNYSKMTKKELIEEILRQESTLADSDHSWMDTLMLFVFALVVGQVGGCAVENYALESGKKVIKLESQTERMGADIIRLYKELHECEAMYYREVVKPSALKGLVPYPSDDKAGNEI